MPKKRFLALMLHEMAYADGEMGSEEIKILFNVFENADIKIQKSGNLFSVFDISNVYFKSCTHIIYYKDQGLSESNFAVKRAIKIEFHLDEKKGYSVTIFNINEVSFIWGKKFEMTPKQMEVLKAEKIKQS